MDFNSTSQPTSSPSQSMDPSSQLMGSPSDTDTNPNQLQVSVTTILQDLFGISQTTASTIFDVMSQQDELENVQQALDNLDDFDDTLIPNSIEDLDFSDDVNEPDNPLDKSTNNLYKKHNTDGWDPKGDRLDNMASRRELPSVSSSMDYPVREHSKPSLLTYLRELSNADIDSSIMSMGDELEQQIDPITRKKIMNMQKNNNVAGADRLKQQALRKINRTQPQKPNTPLDSMVLQRKKQLIAAQKLVKQREEANNG